ncbi:hypothetical protein ACFYW1_36030 [Streptomyces sp. NPDC002669]|uniref:hypothetical protein n=1 Tax=Streptomyces sp. NPDC002669 TaxID=3364658 RepID=UPI00369285B7
MPVNRGPMDSGTTGSAVRCTAGPVPVPVAPGGCGRTTGTGRVAAGADPDPPEGDADAYGSAGAGTRPGRDSPGPRAGGGTSGPAGTTGPPRAERCTSRRREAPIDTPRPARPVPAAVRALLPSEVGRAERAAPAEPPAGARPDGAAPGAPPGTER